MWPRASTSVLPSDLSLRPTELRAPAEVGLSDSRSAAYGDRECDHAGDENCEDGDQTVASSLGVLLLESGSESQASDAASLRRDCFGCSEAGMATGRRSFAVPSTDIARTQGRPVSIGKRTCFRKALLGKLLPSLASQSFMVL